MQSILSLMSVYNTVNDLEANYCYELSLFILCLCLGKGNSECSMPHVHTFKVPRYAKIRNIHAGDGEAAGHLTLGYIIRVLLGSMGDVVGVV